jgi:N-acetylmuramoyl-L-alanine amidase
MYMGRRLLRELDSTPRVDAFLLRTGDGEVISVPERASIAAKGKADLVVSLHVDAWKNPATYGGTILYWPTNSVTCAIANQIASSWPPVLRRTRGGSPATKKDYPQAYNVICTYGRLDTVLCEMGFASNVDDVAAMLEDSVQAMIIGAIKQGILLRVQHLEAGHLKRRKR